MPEKHYYGVTNADAMDFTKIIQILGKNGIHATLSLKIPTAHGDVYGIVSEEDIPKEVLTSIQKTKTLPGISIYSIERFEPPPTQVYEVRVSLTSSQIRDAELLARLMAYLESQGTSSKFEEGNLVARLRTTPPLGKLELEAINTNRGQHSGSVDFKGLSIREVVD